MSKQLFRSRFGALSIACLLFAGKLYAQTSVLFIGNSYTYVNDLPSMFEALSENRNHPVTVGSKTNGGYTFQNQWNDPQTFTAIHQQEWNLVVLQAQSQEPSFPADQVNTSTLPYALRLADSAYASSACTNVMYYMTWGRETGDPQWDSINTFDKMNTRLYNAYMRFADNSDAMVAPVASAWKYVRDNNPGIQLYSGDGSHPSLAGTYLVACTFFASVFQETPVGATYYAGLDQATAGILQNAAAWAVLDSLDTYSLHPVDYRTVADFEWTLDGSGVFQGQSTSLHAETLSWDFGGEGTANTATVNHAFNAPGTYTVQLIAGSDCNTDILNVTVVVNTVGTEEWETASLRAFPNPTTGKIQLPDFEGNTITIYTLQGNVLLETTGENGTYDLSALASGMYVIRAGEQTVRVVKN